MMRTLETRSSATLGPFFHKVKLKILKIGGTSNGPVHQLCAPTLSEYFETRDYLEISAVPREITLDRDRQYVLASYLSDIEYCIEECR